ncbi:MAG: hypothetical protein ACR2L4_06865 [Actinomycetota bacterium]
MSRSLKERFREVDQIPTPWDDASRESGSRSLERRPRGMVGVVAIAASLAVAAALAVVVMERDAGPRRVPVTPDAAWLTRTTASCLEQYGPQTLQARSWAFEGVITAIDGPLDASADDPGGSPTSVTLEVVRWFWGGSEEEVSLRTYTSPSSAAEVEKSLGARLLLAGEEDFLWACGFTRPYAQERLQEFQAAASARAG